MQPLWSSNSLVIMMKLNATAQPWDVDMDDALERRYAEIAPMIENIVRRTLPWLLSREISQSQLPL